MESMTSQLIIVDPGHFHAALVQKEMYPWLAPRVAVYAPLGDDILDYLGRIARFNSRSENPTNWELDVHLCADPMERMLRERPGNIAVFAGHNRLKIDRILAALEAGLHVLADKPWIISSRDLPKLEEALAVAGRNGLVAYDMMTERYEVTSELQRAFVNDAEVFGPIEAGTAAEPGVRARSVHHLMKLVAGVPLRRPAWFFDVAELGEGLADVGTHLVDLVQWTAFPGQAIDYRKDIGLVEGRRWPLALSKAQFAQVTGQELAADSLDYYCNNSVYYTLRGVHVKLETVWHWEAPAGSGDVYEAMFRGTRARVEIRQGPAERYIPELYVVPAADGVPAAVRRRAEALGLAVAGTDDELRIVVPEKLRVGHEAHFAQVTNRFFDCVKSPQSMPAWERDCMVAKYYVSTGGVDLGHGQA